nr:NADH-plastoquinone oxidoreductase subunit J [Selaginella remotifolia]
MLDLSATPASPVRGQVSAWLAEHRLAHRPLGFDHQGIETIQIQYGDWPSVAVALYVYGFDYLRAQFAYDVAPGGLLASVYYITGVRDDTDQLEELCVKVYTSKKDPATPSVYWIWKSSDFQERESYDMLGIIYENHPRMKRILLPDTWVGWPLRKDYIVPDFYELQDCL